MVSANQAAALPEALDTMLILLRSLADNAGEIAKIKRQLFEAYKAEGFTDQQALDLIKGMTGII